MPLRLTKEATERRNDGMAMQPLRWELMLDPAGRSGAHNMSLDASLLAESQSTGRAFLRLYRFSPSCLSLGRNESMARFDQAAIRRLGLDVVRRPTGGRAVWHEHEVTYAVAAPIAAFGSLRHAYRAIHERLATAIRSLGVDASINLHRPPPTSPNLHQPPCCFASAVGGEVMVRGRKLIGSAQLRQRDAFLQHGSILLDGSQQMVNVVRHRSAAGSRETTLSAELGRPVAFEEVAEVIVATWGEESTFTNLSQPASVVRCAARA
jgi:lipoyl(octanoyl) transferase